MIHISGAYRSSLFKFEAFLTHVIASLPLSSFVVHLKQEDVRESVPDFGNSWLLWLETLVRTPRYLPLGCFPDST